MTLTLSKNKFGKSLNYWRKFYYDKSEVKDTFLLVLPSCFLSVALWSRDVDVILRSGFQLVSQGLAIKVMKNNGYEQGLGPNSLSQLIAISFADVSYAEYQSWATVT